MFTLPETKEFEWDEGNIDKNCKKHGIGPLEAEEVFLDAYLKIKKDVKHSQGEDRLIAFGRNSFGDILFVVFTIRGDKMRIISARKANRKERNVYER